MRDWRGIALLHYQGDSLIETADLGQGVGIGPVPEFVKRDAGLEKTLSLYQKIRIEDARAALLKEYQADCIGNTQKETSISIKLANLSLWIAKPSIAGFEFLVHYEKSEDGDWHYRSYGNHRRLNPHRYAVIPPDPDKLGNRLDSNDFELARRLNDSIHGLPRPSSVWTAIRMLWKALTETDSDIRFLLLWVALDALFGADREIRYMISHRIAFFLGNDADEARNVYEQAFAGYGWRNTLAHGGQPTRRQKKDDMDHRGWESEEILRRALNKILLSTDLIRSFSGSDRENYLNDLMFSFPQ